MPQILIVDDHQLIRFGLKQILEAEYGDKLVVGEAQNADEAMTVVHKRSWDIAIVDINLPGRSGLLLIEDFRNGCPNLPILVLTAYSEEEFALRVLKAGAAGFVAKESTHAELVKAVQTILSGQKYLTPTTAQILLSQLGPNPGELPHEKLSDREFQVMLLLGKGKTPTEIANELALSIKTVSTYRTRILEKLHLDNNAQIVHYAVTHNLVAF